MQKFLIDALEAKQVVKVITINGYQLKGKIVETDFDGGTITLDTYGDKNLIFIHAISTIVVKGE